MKTIICTAICDPTHSQRLLAYIGKIDPGFRATLAGRSGAEVRRRINQRFDISVANDRLPRYVQTTIDTLTAKLGIPEHA